MITRPEEGSEEDKLLQACLHPKDWIELILNFTFLITTYVFTKKKQNSPSISFNKEYGCRDLFNT